MSNIDWSKAPEGATHYANSNTLLYPWHNRDTKSFYNGDAHMWIEYTSEQSFEKAILGAIPRPTEQPQWNGEGWPPVGSMVEVHNHEGYEVIYGHDVIGKAVKLLGIVTRSTGTKVAVVEYEEAAYCFRLSCIFPIKSERDRQIEAIESIVSSVAAGSDVEPIAEALYNAGCRIWGVE